MKIFELHFNPKLKEDYIFDTFVFEPSNQYEKRLGSLYQIGELKNVLPQNTKFLDNLAKVIKDKYFTLSSKTPERAITESLKEANEFLGGELKKNNVNWLGNLNFAVLSLKDFDLTFAKTGDIKILMLRGGIITDIGKNLEIEKIEPYPLKVFLNIVSGKLMANDIVLAITKDLFEYFSQQKTLEKLAKAGLLDEKKIRDIFPEESFAKKEKTKMAGVCLIFSLEEQVAKYKRARSIFLPRKKEFNLSSIIVSFSKIFVKIKKRFFNLKILPKPSVKTGEKPEKERKEIKIKAPSSIFPKELEVKKKIYLIFFLLTLLLLGFLIFKREKSKIDVINNSFLKIEEKVKEAQKNLVFKNTETARTLFTEAWREIAPLLETKNQNIISLKKQIEENLVSLNNINKIENPELFYELKPKEASFKAEKVLFSNNNFFFYSNSSKDIYNLNLEEEKLNLIEPEKSFDLAVSDSGAFFLFSAPNIISIFKNGTWQEENIQFSQSPVISQMVSYYSNFYFLDKKNCQILKLILADLRTSPRVQNKYPQSWLKEKLKQDCSGIKSISIDGSLWLLNKDNSIDVYRKGLYQKTIKVDVFPFVENITKIEVKINVPYLYLLEPSKKRIIILNKEGKIFKQFISEKFDNLQDFVISEDGKTIYLLNGSKVYSIEI
jgi:hypothetical protein